jgi:hypothetical protein
VALSGHEKVDLAVGHLLQARLNNAADAGEQAGVARVDLAASYSASWRSAPGGAQASQSRLGFYNNGFAHSGRDAPRRMSRYTRLWSGVFTLKPFATIQPWQLIPTASVSRTSGSRPYT